MSRNVERVILALRGAAGTLSVAQINYLASPTQTTTVFRPHQQDAVRDITLVDSNDWAADDDNNNNKINVRSLKRAAKGARKRARTTYRLGYTLPVAVAVDEISMRSPTADKATPPIAAMPRPNAKVQLQFSSVQLSPYGAASIYLYALVQPTLVLPTIEPAAMTPMSHSENLVFARLPLFVLLGSLALGWVGLDV
ncbi:hypothetical protein BDV95DRAFT_604453 [Massariosphaeria phaeospora]|uniref:Uncharacterized protein n=1 Tax=Massariosphaeria phaeospora TaxID=100035 RepID=A0A7C8IJC1_9PLEO|nr:hypothetical protein BDV95DRAFT_604453 [Massariosphaeria phaeospora]